MKKIQVIVVADVPDNVKPNRIAHDCVRAVNRHLEDYDTPPNAAASAQFIPIEWNEEGAGQ